MGFDYTYQGGDMFIPKDKIAAIDADFLKKKYEISDEDISKEKAEYTYPLTNEEMAIIALLNIIASKSDWYVNYSDHIRNDDWEVIGDGAEIRFHTMHSGEYIEWLDDIAKFVKTGTYVQVVDDNYTVYRLVAKNDVIEKTYPAWDM